MRKKVLAILAATVFISLLIYISFATVAPDLAIRSISGTLGWDNNWDRYNLDYEWTVTNVGSVKAFYHWEECLYPWDGGPFAVQLKLPTGEWIWVYELVYSYTPDSLDSGQSHTRRITNLALSSTASKYIKDKSGVYILAFVQNVVAEDGTPETNVHDNVGKSWMSSGAAVGGVLVPIDKLGLWTPYICLSSLITAAVTAVIYVQHVKDGKKEQ